MLPALSRYVTVGIAVMLRWGGGGVLTGLLLHSGEPLPHHRGGGGRVLTGLLRQWETLPRHRGGGGAGGLHSANTSQY
jgi:hypothetical protein